MTRISVPLSVDGLGQAIREIEAYKLRLNQKCARLAQLIAERVQWDASRGFMGSIADDIYAVIDADGTYRPAGDRPTPEVSVDILSNGNLQVVVASGPDVVFVEFGAGIHFNGDEGSSPHPKGNEFNYLIGRYGDGHGANHAWGFPEDGEIKLTHGTPASMPLYHAVENARELIQDLAREVFSE